MKKFALLLVALIVVWAFALPDDEFPKRLVAKMIEMVQMRPQEKVYLHTDRDHYEVGEKVWFRAYLTNAVNHKPSNFSRYVYVELRDRQDSLRAKVKIGLRDSIFAGYLPLAEKLPQGDYFLRAYTYWMQNAGDEFVFRKQIRVLNPKDTKVMNEVKLEKTDKGEVVKVRFFNSRQENYAKTIVDYTVNGKIRGGTTDENGCLFIKIDSTAYGRKALLQFREDVPFAFNRYVYLPDPREDFEVTFMPEGGDLLSGCQQTVAFKAIGPDGLSRSVSGVVLNNLREQVAFLQTLHKGMGAFDLMVEPGKRYYAELSMNNGKVKRFELPVPKTEGIALKVLSSAEVLGYVVMGADSTQVPENLFIVAHSRGVPILCQPVTIGAKGRMLANSLPEGILHLLLMDGNGEVYSERLCFIRKNNRPDIQIQTDQAEYAVRAPVNVDLQVTAPEGKPVTGSFSMSVIADGKCERDSLGDNIFSYLLLTSDLKGYVEEPTAYFKDNRVSTRRFLDLLMLTQGWSRFDIQRVLKHDYDTLQYYMERGQVVSGQVKNFWGKDAIDANLILLGTTGLFRMINADSSGHFVIDGINFPEGTQFILQGKSKKGRKSVEVVVDKDEFLRPSVEIPVGTELLEREDEFYKRFTRDFYYENGEKVYVLDEFTVKQKVKAKSYSFYDGMADYNLDSAKLASLANKDIRIVFEEFPGLEPWGDSLTRFGKPIYVLVNDFEEEWNYILNLNPKDIVSVSYIRPPMSTSLWGAKAENGAVVITMNPNFVGREVPRLNMVTFSLLGYQKKAEFYMPHYEVDSVRLALKDTVDYRTTLYWNPNIQTDAEGKAKCYFTTSDGYGPYTVIIEGILNDGTVCRKEEKVKLKTW